MDAEDRLSLASLGRLRGAARPGYDPAAAGCGLVHLGVGAFHRAHQAVYLDDCLAAGETGWGVIGASLQSAGMRDALAPQDGLYTLVDRDGGGDRLRVVGSLRQVLVAPEDPAALVARMADPAIRIVTLTVTEKAYLRRADGGLDLDHPAIRADLANPGAPRTVHGFLHAALVARRAAGVAPFTLLSCDNLPSNGATLKRLLAEYAGAAGAGLAGLVRDDLACPSSMVDRIVPATTDADRALVAATTGLRDAWPVVTEPFRQWVVEEDFPLGRPDWERAGVTMVRDVAPHEEMKLRILNGAHSAMAYLGLLAGHPSVAAAFGDPALRRFVEGLWDEAATSLPPGLDVAAYRVALAGRFSNPALVHRLAQIANDGSQKLPQRIVAAARARLDAGQPADHLALAVAGWIAALSARGRALPDGLFTDPLDGALAPVLARGGPAEARVADLFRLSGFAGVAGGQARALEDRVSRALALIEARGVAAALALAPGGGA